ncbi:MAG: peptide chain release factor N(5)-glutamine methyltransferase [Sphaerochaetaceae bacterium]|jgi:release factor glutamine methyltransferase
MTSIAQALKNATTAIAKAEVTETPLLDATLLLMHVTGYKREELYLYGDKDLSKESSILFEALLKKRQSGFPIAYLIGKRDFYNHTFKVTEDVLIPRADSEIIVEQALHLLKTGDKVLDLGTGSGVLGISLAAENPTIQLTLSDISTKALEVAKQNSIAILNRTVTIIHSDLFSSLQNRSFNMIITNPPYLTASWYDQVALQVKKEPKLALVDKGEDGLHTIGKIVESSPNHLEQGGTLLIECDYRQNSEVATLMKKRGFTSVRQVKDYGNLRRVVWGRFYA